MALIRGELQRSPTHDVCRADIGSSFDENSHCLEPPLRGSRVKGCLAQCIHGVQIGSLVHEEAQQFDMSLASGVMEW